MAKQETLEASIKTERRRLQKARDKAARKKKEIDQELESVERELAAIDAYETAKGGAAARAAKRGTAKRPATRRGPRGAKRAAVLDVVSKHPDGLSRGEILNLIGAKGDKSAEQAVSNALSALTKQNQLGRRDGKYIPV